MRVATYIKENSAVIFMAICAILCATISAYTPYHCDDLNYLIPFYDFKEGIDSFDLNVVWEQIIWQYENVNGRFGDKILYLFLLIPKPIFACICGLAIFLLLYFASKITFHDKEFKNKGSSILLTSAIMIFFPWGDHIFLVAFSSNYILSSAFVLVVIYYFLHPDKINNKYRQTGICLLSIIAAPWHEAFGFCVAVAMTIFLIVTRKIINRLQIAIYCFWLSGCLSFILAPGMWSRAENIENDIQNAGTISFNFVYAIPIIAFGLLLIYLGLKRKLNSIPNLKLHYFTLITCICNMLIVLNFGGGSPRIFSFGILFSIISIANYLTEFNSYKPFLISSISSIFIFLHLTFCAALQHNLYYQYINVIDLYKNSKTGVVFYDIYNYNYSSILSLRKTSWYQFHTDNICITNYYQHKKPLTIIPTELEHISPSEDNLFCKRHDIYRHNEYFFSKTDLKQPVITAILDDSRQFDFHFNSVPYKNSKGETLYYIDIFYRILAGKGKIVKIL